jgi:hypothetical protein
MRNAVNIVIAHVAVQNDRVIPGQRVVNRTCLRGNASREIANLALSQAGCARRAEKRSIGYYLGVLLASEYIYPYSSFDVESRRLSAIRNRNGALEICR